MKIFMALVPCLLMPSSAVEAQFFCGEFQFSGCPIGFHWMTIVESGGVDNMHGDCRSCIFGPCHVGCAETENEELDEILSVAEARDHGALVEFARSGSAWLALNPSRKALVILNCSRTGLIAHIPLSPTELESVEQLVAKGVLQSTDRMDFRPGHD